MRRFGILFFGFVLSISAAEPRLENLLKSVENRYNHAQSLKLNFTETWTAARTPDRTETGVLTLRKPGRMRWDYSNPVGKVFVSDGKRTSFYDPEANQVEVSGVKETEDMRAPLAFLLGKLNFYKEFRSFNLRTDTQGTWIAADPNSDSLPYSRVEFLIGADAHIERLRVFGQDRSVLDFHFTQERLNVPVEPGIFNYRAPLTAQIVEGDK